jgi:hypothetical protein
VVVGAFGADREQLVTAARQQHRFARNVSQDHAAFGDIRQRHSLGQVGSVELLLLFAHGRLLTYGAWQISQLRFYFLPHWSSRLAVEMEVISERTRDKIAARHDGELTNVAGSGPVESAWRTAPQRAVEPAG